jgi:sugar-specific transcriptional regulator TrmB
MNDIQESFEILSELEEKRIEVFKEFLKELKPILRKGVVESLNVSVAAGICLSEVRRQRINL